MKERPILFSTPMVKALLAGRKTQTRRITHDNGETLIGYEYVKDVATYPEYWKGKKSETYTGWVAKFSNLPIMMPRSCPFGEVGDILWVRETWSEEGFEGNFIYKADGLNLLSDRARWHPSIHMPKRGSRIWLDVTDIRAHRLQEISKEDAIAEGVQFTDFGKDRYGQQERGYHVYDVRGPEYCLLTPQTAFGNLWEKINGPDSWNVNPWVWAITFKVLSTIGKPENI